MRRRTVLFLAVMMVALLMVASPAWASTFTVNSTNDRGDEAASNGSCFTGVLIVDPADGFGTVPECTLRAAIQEANVNDQSDTIDFLPGLGGTITLSLGELVIANEHLGGSDANDLSIEGPGAGLLTVSGNEASRVFKISEFAHAAISGLAISNGRASSGGSGGGIFNDAGTTLTLSDTTVSGNTASFVGGGIYSQGRLTLTDSTVSGNAVYGPIGGGGIYNGGFLQLIGTTVSDNTADGADTGGGIGGGILNLNFATITSTTVSGNTADYGGGVRNQEGTLNLINTTVSDNTATWEGGGVVNNDSTRLRNTIIARNSAPSAPDVLGSLRTTFESQGYNLIGNTNGSMGWGRSDLKNLNPLLGPLQNNGGPTQTHALKKGSPALNAIPKATNGCGTEITTDQRGMKRPQGKRCDIGSFEKKQKRRR